MTTAGALRSSLALAAGAATVFGFAPFGLAALPIVTLALLVVLWQGAASARSAAATGFAFGLGLFGAGASWVFIALNTFGGMPLPLAALATGGFCAFLALYPAAAGWAAARWTMPGSWQRAVAAAAAWTLAEWARSVVFTGFPWLSLGYAALGETARSPLAGYAPVGGAFLVTLAIAAVAAALALFVDALAAAAQDARCVPARRDRRRVRGRRRAGARRMDSPVRHAGRRVARSGQRHAGPEVRPRFPPDDLRPLPPTRRRESRAARRAARECIPGVRGRGARGRAATGAGHRGSARRRCAGRPVHRRAAARPGGRAALLQQRRECGSQSTPALSQAPSRPFRRNDSAGARRRLVHPQRPVDSAREPGLGRA